MGIPRGITLIVGGGFHGKSTMLEALQVGVYNKIPGDGREFVITEPNAVKVILWAKFFVYTFGMVHILNIVVQLLNDNLQVKLVYHSYLLYLLHLLSKLCVCTSLQPMNCLYSKYNARL